nr:MULTISPECIES: lysylphosphatidylglycerol synthase transmembrane domain-containing protein [Myxococcaceae]
MEALVAEAEAPSPRRTFWLRVGQWGVGGAILVALGIAVARFGEQRQLLEIAREARPAWLLLALALQALTYVADARLWEHILVEAGTHRPLRRLLQLTVAKYFLDQAFPSGGVSGTVLVVRSLTRSGVAPSTASAALVLRLATRWLTYALALLLALGAALAWSKLPDAALGAAALFTLGLFALSGLLVWLMWSPPQKAHPLLERVKPLRGVVRWVLAADAGVMQSPSLFARASWLQLAVQVLDAATLWAGLAAVGERGALLPVLAAFMLASAFRSVAVVPGGLGTFEAGSVGALVAFGIPAVPALAATLVFRGLSFWLPLLPGAALAHRETRRRLRAR